jgi:NAD(P)-dependent dehydrogenase (short-subunit alcohol dehydrogenase family)
VTIVTGGGRGIGREEALLFPREGTKFVVNAPGTAWTGGGVSRGPAQEVVAATLAGGGQAAPNADDISDWD